MSTPRGRVGFVTRSRALSANVLVVMNTPRSTPLRGSMNADDFRDYMLSFLFLRYLCLSSARELQFCSAASRMYQTRAASFSTRASRR